MGLHVGEYMAWDCMWVNNYMAWDCMCRVSSKIFVWGGGGGGGTLYMYTVERRT